MSTLEAVLQAHLPKIRFLSHRMAMQCDPTWGADDLAQEGALRFLDAVAQYDPTRGAALWTYAEFLVLGHMRDARRELDPVPRSLRRKARVIAQAMHALSQQHGRAPDAPAVAQALGISLGTYEQWRTALACLEPMWSLDYCYDTGEAEGEQYVFLADPGPGPAQQMEQADARRQRAAALAGAMALLPAREYQVLRLRYWEEQSLKIISAQLGVSESRVCQMHKAALARLRCWLTTDDDWPGVAAELTQRQASCQAQMMARLNVLRTHGWGAYLRLWRAQQKEKKHD